MKVYLAAQFPRREEMAGIKSELESAGFVVTSCWIEAPGAEVRSAEPEELARCAAMDLEDLRSADVLIAFSEEHDSGYYTGGRHVELGYALALQIPVLLIGPIENVFHALSDVWRFPSWSPDVIRAARSCSRVRSVHWGRELEQFHPVKEEEE